MIACLATHGFGSPDDCRCAEVNTQIKKAAQLMRRLGTAVPVSLATIDLSDASNARMVIEGYPHLRRQPELAYAAPGASGVVSGTPGQSAPLVSFPVGRIYASGEDLGVYRRGSSFTEIAREMMRHAEELKAHRDAPTRPERAARGGGRHDGGGDTVTEPVRDFGKSERAGG